MASKLSNTGGEAHFQTCPQNFPEHSLGSSEKKLCFCCWHLWVAFPATTPQHKGHSESSSWAPSSLQVQACPGSPLHLAFFPVLSGRHWKACGKRFMDTWPGEGLQMGRRAHVDFHFWLENYSFWGCSKPECEALVAPGYLACLQAGLKGGSCQMLLASPSVCIRTAKSLWCLVITSTPGHQLASLSPGDRGWACGAHLRVVLLMRLAPLLHPQGLTKGPFNWPPQSGSRWAWDFCVIVQEMWLQKPHHWCCFPHGWPCISSATAWSQTVSSADIGFLEPWLHWAWAWRIIAHSQKIASQAQTPDTSRGEGGGTGSEGKWAWTLKTSSVSFKPNSTWCVEIGVVGPSVKSLSEILLWLSQHSRASHHPHVGWCLVWNPFSTLFSALDPSNSHTALPHIIPCDLEQGSSS